MLLFIFIYFAITGSYLTAPENKIFDYLFIYPFWISFLLMLQCAIFFIPLDLIKLILFGAKKETKLGFERIQSAILFLIIGFFLFYVPIRIIYDYNSISIRTVEYKKEIFLHLLKILSLYLFQTSRQIITQMKAD